MTLQTTTPSDVETEIAALRRGRDVRICTEPKLAIHPIPNQHQDHSAEHLRRGLPDYFSGVGVGIGPMMLSKRILTSFSPMGLDVGCGMLPGLQRHPPAAAVIRLFGLYALALVPFWYQDDRHHNGRFFSDTERAKTWEGKGLKMVQWRLRGVGFIVIRIGLIDEFDEFDVWDEFDEFDAWDEFDEFDEEAQAGGLSQ